MRSPPEMRRCYGFSLIELIVALAVTGILATGLTLWMSRPLEALQDAHRRSAALDRIGRVAARLQRELPEALPNSVRVGCGGRCLEFIPVVDYGDYRAGLPGDLLDFGAPDDRFDVLKPLAVVPQAGLHVVINNQNALPSGSASAYSNDAANNRAVVSAGSSAAQISISAKQFPAPSPAQRFFLIGSPVSYLCAPQASGGSIRRYTSYAVQALQPTNPALGDLLAGGIVACSFNLSAPNLLSLSLAAGGDAGEAVSSLVQLRLYHEP